MRRHVEPLREPENGCLLTAQPTASGEHQLVTMVLAVAGNGGNQRNR
jgi:hypothetical protein